MNVAFWANQLCERGTSVSLYDYAYYNEKLLNNKSFIFYDKNSVFNNNKVIEKFQEKFIVHSTTDFGEVDKYIMKYNITHIYIIKSGEYDNKLSKKAKNCIHCVFNCNYPHGEIYSVISSSVDGYNNNYPIVPHMINLPEHKENMRDQLNIPKTAIVFGGYGGKGTFSISFVPSVVYNIAKDNPNIYFLFANYDNFCPNLSNLLFLPLITDLNEKVKFINTIDAMLWARADGETFGIAIGEFSSKNKPIICMDIGSKSHICLLKDKAILYSDKKSLENILLNFNPVVEKNKEWNAYKDFTPEKVMNIFKNVFLN